MMRLVFHLLLLTTLLVSPAAAQNRGPRVDSNLTKGSDTLKGAFREVTGPASQSTVAIRCDDKLAILGTIVSADGYILTKASELNGRIMVRLPSGRETRGRIVGVVSQSDLAMIKIDAIGLKPIEWASMDEVKVGHFVASVNQTPNPMAIGVVSVGKRRIPGGSAVMGVLLEDGDNGARIDQVVPESGADNAGLRIDDIITGIDGQATPSRDELMAAMGYRQPGESVTVHFNRDGQEMRALVTLAQRPVNPFDARARFQNSLGRILSARANGCPSVIQHDTILDAHQCGGPVVLLNGKAIGIHIASASRVETYALPADVIQPLLSGLKSGKYPTTTQPATSPASQPLP